MRKISLYPKLAASALKKSIRIYLPYLLACTGTVMMFNLLMTLAIDPEVSALRGGAQVQMVLNFGCVVVAIFSAILLFYTNGVIVRQRKREFGLYNILGMEKRHVGLVLLWETFYTALIAFALGVAGAALFSKLMQMIIMRVLGAEVNLSIHFSSRAAIATFLLFAAIFLLTLMKNLAVIFRAQPVELLRSASEGEREPKARWILALLGAISLGAGYFLAVSVDDVYNAIALFFVAVILVIIGTYLLFAAFSIVLLKALRKNRRYYYKTNHFVSVSGMIYRMKRNAMGLASICILSTMVLVTVSSTFCLYAGLGEIMDARYPTDVSVHFWVRDATPEMRANAVERIEAIAAEHGLAVQNPRNYRELSFVAALEPDGETLDFSKEMSANPMLSLTFVPLEDYIAAGGAPVSLDDGEALCFDAHAPALERLNAGEVSLSLKRVDSFPVSVSNLVSLDWTPFIVVRDMAALERIDEVQRAAYGTTASRIRSIYNFDLSGSDEEKAACQEDMAYYANRESGCVSRLDGKQRDYIEEYVSMYGSMFFLGMFLGLLFIMSTVTIMYYKQVSEGMDDADRFAILQKVGMTRAEVRSAIRSQVLTVFFLPLGTAAVHVAFAFPMVLYILRAFGMINTRLFAYSTLGCFGVFAALYVLVYSLTARAYGRIVGGAR